MLVKKYSKSLILVSLMIASSGSIFAMKKIEEVLLLREKKRIADEMILEVAKNKKRLEQLELESKKELFKACQEGFIEKVREAISSSCFGVEVRDEQGYTSLCKAAEYGRFDIVKYLVEEENADKEAKNKTIESLLGLGFKPRAVYSKGEAPLYCAAANGHFYVVKYLVQQGANIDVKDAQGNSPLYVAMEKSFFRIVQYLVKMGASPISKKVRVDGKDIVRGYAVLARIYKYENYEIKDMIKTIRCFLSGSYILLASDPVVRGLSENKVFLDLVLYKAIFYVVKKLFSGQMSDENFKEVQELVLLIEKKITEEDIERAFYDIDMLINKKGVLKLLNWYLSFKGIIVLEDIIPQGKTDFYFAKIMWDMLVRFSLVPDIDSVEKDFQERYYFMLGHISEQNNEIGVASCKVKLEDRYFFAPQLLGYMNKGFRYTPDEMVRKEKEVERLNILKKFHDEKMGKLERDEIEKMREFRIKERQRIKEEIKRSLKQEVIQYEAQIKQQCEQEKLRKIQEKKEATKRNLEEERRKAREAIKQAEAIIRSFQNDESFKKKEQRVLSEAKERKPKKKKKWKLKRILGEVIPI